MTKIKKSLEEKKQFVWPKKSDMRKVLNGGKKKKCGRCGKWKNLDSFPADNNRIDHLYIYCRDCESVRQKLKNAKKKKRVK